MTSGFPDGEADALIAALGLAPHPEGGHYREAYRDPDPPGGRGAATSIYYLLKAGERSHWHRVDAVEIWIHLAGGPLALHLSPDGRESTRRILGRDSAAGEQTQVTVAKGAWQSAAPLGAFVLAACVVAPAFRFEGFELAPSGWAPGRGHP